MWFHILFTTIEHRLLYHSQSHYVRCFEPFRLFTHFFTRVFYWEKHRIRDSLESFGGLRTSWSDSISKLQMNLVATKKIFSPINRIGALSNGLEFEHWILSMNSHRITSKYLVKSAQRLVKFRSTSNKIETNNRTVTDFCWAARR